MKRDLYIASIRQLFVFALLLLLVSQAAISLFAWSAIEEKIRPELDRKAMTVGVSAANKIVRALNYGIPFQRLEGLKDFFDEILKKNDDLGFLAITNREGQVVFSSGVNRDQVSAALAMRGPGIDQPIMGASTIRVADDVSGRQQKNFLDTSIPIQHQGKTMGVLHVGVDQNFIASKIYDLRYDIGIILLVSMLIAFEILLFIVSLNFLGPMRQIADLMTHLASGDFSHRAVITVKESLGSLMARLNQVGDRVNQTFTEVVWFASEVAAKNPAITSSSSTILARLRTRYVFAEEGTTHDLVQQRIVSIRILTFLFMFADMLSRPFLPLYVGTLPTPGFGLAADFAASIPITAYLLGVACSMPFAGRWSDRMGRRNSYAVGAVIVMIGLICTGIASSFIVLLLGRMITGIGYAMMYMSCQGYVVDNTDDNNRSQGVASFVGAIMVSEICAPAVGGILADRIGYRPVFVFGALITLIAAVLAIRTLDNKGVKSNINADKQPKPLASLVKNYRFMAISILAGIPAKLLLSGFLIYLVPVILAGLNSSKSEIGRYAMIYGIVALTLTPVFARITDRYGAHTMMVGVGGLLTGVGLLPIFLNANSGNVLLGIAALGLGQSMSISAQLTLVTTVTRKEANANGTAAVLGVFRLIERLGGAAGPSIAGALVALYGPTHAMAALGVFGTISSMLFLMVFSAGDAKSDKKDGETKVMSKGNSA